MNKRTTAFEYFYDATDNPITVMLALLIYQLGENLLVQIEAFT